MFPPMNLDSVTHFPVEDGGSDPDPLLGLSFKKLTDLFSAFGDICSGTQLPC